MSNQKTQIVLILSGQLSDKAKFNQLMPILRMQEPVKSELRKACNLGFTELRFSKMVATLKLKNAITEEDLFSDLSEQPSTDTPGPSTENAKPTTETEEKEIDYKKLSIAKLKELLSEKGVDEEQYKSLNKKADLIALIPEEKKS